MDKKNFLKENTHAEYYSGLVTFSPDYISRFQLVDACLKVSKDHPEFLQMRVRGGTNGYFALDLLLDGTKLPKEEQKVNGLNYMRRLFKDILGDDYIKNYDLSNRVVVIK